MNKTVRDQNDSWRKVSGGEHARASELNRFTLVALVTYWVGFVVIYSVRSALIEPSPLANLIPRILVALYGAALSWLMYQVLEKMQPRSIGGAMMRAISISFPISVLFTVGHELIFTPLAKVQCALPAGAKCPPPDLWTTFVDNTVNWTFLFAAWGLVQLAARSTLERWAADKRASEQREATRIAEIRALRYQVNPHFLFNCLNSLATLVRRSNPTEAEEMIGELGAFLRYGLATDLLTDVDLHDEVEMQQRYLALECRRFADRLSVDVELAQDAVQARVPSLILQPLVENAISHGVAMTTAHTNVTIRAWVAAAGRLSIVVEDDAWAGEDDQNASGEGAGLGIGLRNVSARLAARFGDSASCSTMKVPNGGFRAVIEMPLVLAGSLNEKREQHSPSSP